MKSTIGGHLIKPSEHKADALHNQQLHTISHTFSQWLRRYSQCGTTKFIHLFPPSRILFVTCHKHLGDISKGRTRAMNRGKFLLNLLDTTRV